MNLLRSILLPVLLLGAARAGSPEIVLLRPGEELIYHVSWGWFGQAGELKVSAASDPHEGAKQTRVTTISSTRGFMRAFYRFDGEARMIFDAHDGRLLSSTATSDSGKERTQTSIVFNYAKSEAAYVDHLHPARNASLLIPAGRPMDIATGLIQTRVWALQPGESRDVLVVFENEFYPLHITAERVEIVQAADGPRKAVLLVPHLVGPPKGMFRREGKVRVWVSADEDRLPVRFEVKLKIGTVRAVLTDYRAPAPD
ncbi:MAG TPA: DUF3108 domain-containing protein [Rariglobus sp.]